MKTITKSLWAAGVAAFMVTPVLAAPGHGTDILHFSLREGFTNTGVESGASGRIDASQNKQGKANNQKLDISVSGLTGSTTYTLVATTVSNTSPTAVTNFTTDGNGNATIHFHSAGKGHGDGKGNMALPDVLNPVSQIRELDIVNGSTTVLSADLTAPDKLQFLVKRDISDGNTNGVSAQLMVKASSTSQATFTLTASKLAASSDYSLALNGTSVDSGTSNAHGKLKIKSVQSVDVLDVNSVALWDSGNNVVVSTTLP